jgi:hypothetical protein
MDPDSNRILLFSSLNFKTPKKLIFFYSFSAYYFLKVHLHHFSKIIHLANGSGSGPGGTKICGSGGSGSKGFGSGSGSAILFAVW